MPPAGVGGDQFLDGGVVGIRVVGPRDDADGVGLVDQRTVDRVGELLVVDHCVGALAVDDVGQRGPANDVLSSRMSAPIRLAATNASTKPR